MTRLAALATITALLSPCRFEPLPQDGVRDVPPGREIRETKLLSPGLTDIWKLDVEEDEVLWCVVESGAFDPVLSLLDDASRQLDENDGAGTRSELRLRMERKGPVQFKVHGFQGAGGGPYTFWLQRYRTQALSTRGEASHTFGKEQWWHYRVALRAGEVLVPAVQGEGNVTAVFGADGANLDERHGGYVAPRAGDCFVRVEGADGRTCNLTTQLARVRDLAPAQPADDHVPPFGFDVWRLRLEAGVACVFELEMPGPQLEFELRERRPGQEPAIAWPGQLDKGGQRRRWAFARRDGEVEVLLRNRGGEATPYRLLYHVPAATQRPGAAVAGTLALGDGDLHRIDVGGGELLRVTVKSRAFDARFDLWDPDGGVIVHGVDDRGPLDRDAEHTLLVPRAGCHRVLVHAHGGGGSGDYTLRADVLPVPELRPGTAAPVDLARGGTCFLRLALEAGQEAWLSVRSRSFDAGLTVLDPNGNAFTCEGGGRGSDVMTGYVATHAGAHTLIVHSRGGAGAGEVRALLP